MRNMYYLLTVDSHSSFLAPKNVLGGGRNRQMMGEMCRGTQKRQTNQKKDKLIKTIQNNPKKDKLFDNLDIWDFGTTISGI